MAESASIENYTEHLAPLLASFERQTNFITGDPDPNRSFTDQFGNFIDFGHTEVWCFAPPLLKLLKDPSMGRIEVTNVDKGTLTYSLYRHADSYYMLYETRMNLYGRGGHYTSFVVVPTLEPVTEFVEAMRKRQLEEEEEDEKEAI
jgi:hypothetical protein